MRHQIALALVIFGFAASPAAADVVFYRLPTSSGSVVVLEGSATVNPGGTVTFSHNRFGKIHFDLENTEIRKAPTVREQFSRQLNRAGNDANKLLEAAHWALRHGLLPQFYSAVD
ncbi:MAG TPA: hypothetical protein VFV87_02915, partial [Pirellulaceae bacterium]|nr:hypothetical protein [Pirellulaceae bacterium]